MVPELFKHNYAVHFKYLCWALAVRYLSIRRPSLYAGHFESSRMPVLWITKGVLGQSSGPAPTFAFRGW